MCLFKDFSESLQSNDFEELTRITEPSFRRKTGAGLEVMHKNLKEQGLEMGIEYNRKHADETSVFLYKIENYFIID